jgi:hypothetical protein
MTDENEIQLVTYFHCAPLPLGDGSIVEPGNWGRIIRLYAPNDGATFAVAYRESLLEAYRQTNCPQKPSRLNCVFACPTLEVARDFQTRWGRLNFIYEIVPLIPTVTHVGDFELCMFQAGVPYFDDFPQRIPRYWSDHPKEHPEVLLSAPVKILKRIAL